MRAITIDFMPGGLPPSPTYLTLSCFFTNSPILAGMEFDQFGNMFALVQCWCSYLMSPEDLVLDAVFVNSVGSQFES